MGFKSDSRAETLVRKLKLAILPALICMLPTQVLLALGLGDIEVFSALNQSLEAEIALTAVRPGETDGMLVRLANEQAFLQAGVERPHYLTQLQFSVAVKPDGTPYVKISTKTPVREPFLSFLVDVDWPRGRLVREYTLLLDPPVFTSRHQKEASVSSSSSAEITSQQNAQLKIPDISVSVDSEPALIRRQPAASQNALQEDHVVLADSEAQLLESEELVDFIDTAPEVVETANSSPFSLEEKKTLASEKETPTETATAATSDKTKQADVEFADDFVVDALDTDESLETIGEVTESVEASTSTFPDINITLDSSIPYDTETTENLLAQFAAEDRTPPVKKSHTTDEDGYGPVAQGDSLWKIASRILPEGVALNQAMLAILRYNPNAFIRDNINSIKKGIVLRIPDKDAMLAIDSVDALTEVRRQNTLWQEYKSQLAGYKTSSDKSDTSRSDVNRQISAAEETIDSTQLSILSPGRDAKASSRASGKQDGLETGSAVYKELLLSQEALEAERLEKTELQSRLKELEGQVDVMQRLISLKDQQLAELQAKLKEVKPQIALTTTQKNPDASNAINLSAENDLSKPALETAQQQVISNQPLDDALKPDDTSSLLKTEKPVASDIDDPLLVDIDDPNAQLESIDLDGTVVDSEIEPEAQTTTQTATIAATPTRPRPIGFVGAIYDLLDSLPSPVGDILKNQLDTPYGIYLIMAIPVLLLGLIWMLFRGKPAAKPVKKPLIIGAHKGSFDQTQDLAVTKKPSIAQRLLGLFKKKDQGGISISGAMDDETDNDDMFSSSEPDNFDEVDDDDYLDDRKSFSDADRGSQDRFKAEKTQIISRAVEEAAEELSYDEPTIIEDSVIEEEEVLDDTTAEADVYLAYGLFDQAEELLKQALKQHPDRKEYMGKLLETYFSGSKKAEFVGAAVELRGLLGNKPGRLWEKAVAMGKEIAPENELFKGADTSRYKASDFALAKPETTDIELGGGDTATKPDLDLGIDEDMPDFDLGADDNLIQAKSNMMNETVITPLDTISAEDEVAQLQGFGDDLEFDLSESEDEDAGFELDLDFDAGDLGLDVTNVSDRNDDADDEDDAEKDILANVGGSHRAPEETVALDMDMELGALDLGSIDDTDFDLGNEDLDEEESEIDFDIGGGDLASDLDVDISNEIDLDFSAAETEPEKTVVMTAAGDALLAEMDDAIDFTDSGDITMDDTIIEDDEEEDTFIDDENESFGGGADEVNTKLDLARAYIDMGDTDGASSTLDEVIAEGSEIQRREAQTLLSQIAR